VFVIYRTIQRKVIEDASTRLAVLAMNRIEEHLPKAMLEEAGTVFRVMMNQGSVCWEGEE